MTSLLSDFGGTYARVATVEDGKPSGVERYDMGNFPDIATILDHYCERKELPKGGDARIATAANPDADGIWRFTNNPKHAIDKAALEKAGWTVLALEDDFVASAWGCLSLGDDEMTTLRPGKPRKDAPRALLGPGTGLGLAYMMPLANGGWHVQQTFGGHMLAAAQTREQQEIMEIVSNLKPDKAPAVPEDVASGRGLMNLYRAVCIYHDIAVDYKTGADLLENADEQGPWETLKMFHQYLGLFAHHALVTGHAYGGLYLDGGMVQALRRHALFDFVTFSRAMDQNLAAVVKESVENTPIWVVEDPYIALRGLSVMPGPDTKKTKAKK
jgi:glucokinase